MNPLPDLDKPSSGTDVAALPEDLLRLARVARESLGIEVPPFKLTILRHRLSGRIRELGLPSLGTYLDLLGSPDAGSERDRLVSAITTNVTQFFREAHHFESLAQEALPDLVTRARAGQRVRIWSAGCSSGQEPFSIAACILDLCPEAPRLDVKVLATDVDAEVLGRARRATYPGEEARQLSPTRRLALFGDAGAREPVRIRDDVAGLVAFNRLNLLDHWPMRHPFDAIFCRNVVIYLDASFRERLWQRLVAALRDGGWLFIGHAERVLGPALVQLDHAGVTTYRKHPGPPPARQSGV